MTAPMNSRVSTFLKTIGPTDAQNKEVKSELDFMEKKIKNFVRDDDDVRFVKALRSGSYAKHTLLRRHKEGDFDADIAIYLDPGSDRDGDRMLDYVERLLRRAYENRESRKPRFDRSGKSAVRMIFDDSPKINIDAVPVIDTPRDSIPNYGEIPRRDGERRKTSVTEHIEFVRTRNGRFSQTPFHNHLRLAKWWRNHAFDENEHASVSSFFLTLVFGKAFDETYGQFTDSWLENLLTMASWVASHRLAAPIRFPDSRVPVATTRLEGPVVVVDPMNADNNIAHDWTHATRDQFLGRVNRLCDLLLETLNEEEDEGEDAAADFLEGVLPRFWEFSE